MAKKRSSKQPARKTAAKRKAAPRKAAPKGATRKTPRKRASAATAARKAGKKTATSRAAKAKRTPKASPAAVAVRGRLAGAVAAVTSRLPWADEGTDAIRLLEADHRRFEDLLKQGEETGTRAVKGRRALLDTLTRELNAHELIEENVLYPELAAHPEAREIVLEGYEEHHVADLIVKELHEVAADNEQWAAKFKVLKENIEHHIKEEEGEMFTTARAVLDADRLQALGARMAQMKAKALRG